MTDDDDDFFDFSYYDVDMGNPFEIRHVKYTEWELSDSGLYEAQATIDRTGDGRFFFSILKSCQGGDLGKSDWHGPFADKDAAIRAAKSAVFHWLRDCDRQFDPRPQPAPPTRRVSPEEAALRAELEAKCARIRDFLAARHAARGEGGRLRPEDPD